MRSSPASACVAAACVLWLSGAALADPPQPPLPAPYATPSVDNPAQVTGWPDDVMPRAKGPFKVTRWADVPRARRILELPNGDILVAQPAFNRISLLRRNGDGAPTVSAFLVAGSGGDPHAPFGMVLVGNHLFVGSPNALWRFPYSSGAGSISASSGVKLLDLPTGGHSSRDLAVSKNGRKLYVSVGSISNVDEWGGDAADPRRAAITEYDIASGRTRIFASGLRNPNGLVWNPVTGRLWTAVNERDGLGDDLVPDFVTSVKERGFYGWPYFYFGDYEDPRKAGERPDLADRSLVPDLAVGAHTSSLGLAFYTGDAFPKRYRGGLFVAQNGSWNRSRPAGYGIAFAPFDRNGAVAGPIQPFLTGFISDRDPLVVRGRPTGVLMLRDGSLVVADDGGGRIWRVTRDGPDDGAPELGGLMLVDARKDSPIFPLTDGMTLDRRKLKVRQFNLIAAEAGPVGSVRFRLDGKVVRTANGPPFTLAPTDLVAGRLDYAAAKLAKGRRRLVATPFAGKNGTGRKGKSISVTFHVE